MTDLPPPAVKFPPPLLYLGMILLGWLIDYLLNIPGVSLASGILNILGSAAILLGIAFNLSAFLHFRKQDENPIPWTGSEQMIASGIYRFTRNPMYLGMSLISLGIGILVGSYALIAAAIIATIIIDRLVIIPEETYLKARFGEGYLAYKTQVRRWI